METSSSFLALGVPFRLHFGVLFGVLGLLWAPLGPTWVKKRRERHQSSILGNAFFEIDPLKGSILGPLLEQFWHKVREKNLSRLCFLGCMV